MIPKKLLISKKKKSIVSKGHRGTSVKPRLSVYRSIRFLYAQLIDDINGKTLISVSLKELAVKDNKIKPMEKALALGELLAQKALKKNIKTAIFDRGKYRYHGRIKNIAEGARKAGLII